MSQNYKLIDNKDCFASASSLEEALTLAQNAVNDDCGPVTITYETATQKVTITVTHEGREVKREPVEDSFPW